MNKNDLYNALSGINKEFIAESENFDAVAADFRKDRVRKIGIAASTLCLALFCVGMMGVFSKTTPKRNNHPTEEELLENWIILRKQDGSSCMVDVMDFERGFEAAEDLPQAISSDF